MAKELNYLYIDSGAMYRAVTLYALKQHLIRNEELNAEKLVAQLDAVYITYKFSTERNQTETWLNGKNV